MTSLDAIRDHLDLYALPPVAAVDVRAWSEPVRVQLEAVDLPGVAGGLLAWVDTLDAVSASVWRVPGGESVHLSIAGRMPGGVPVRVFAGVAFSDEVFSGLAAGAEHDVPVSLLRVWADSGEVAA
jgi:hypothetical protein